MADSAHVLNIRQIGVKVILYTDEWMEPIVYGRW
jgi:hypothetical protein